MTTLGDLVLLGDAWFLALLLPLLAVVGWRARRRRAAADGGSELVLGGLPRTARARSSWLPGALATLAAVLLVVALARPLEGREESIVYTEGIDILLVVDASSSMTNDSIERGVPNLAVVKEVVSEFVQARENDRIGLVSFAQYPRVECPLTLDKEAVLEQLELVEPVRPNSEEDGTAISVAVAYAAAKLRDSDAQSRIAVVLTDGQENVHPIDPDEAVRLCNELGVKVYTVGAGTVLKNQFGMLVEQPMNTDLLRALADATGGRFFRARDALALAEVYAEIDALERTERLDVRYTDYEEQYLWLVAPAAVLLVLAWLLQRGPYLEFAA